MSENSKNIIFEHILVPKHILLSDEEANEVLKKFKIKGYQLPLIKDSDPAIRAIGALPGNIVKIVRKSQTSGEAIFYRYVVKF